MKIYNKLDSFAKINELGLNKFPEAIFKNGEEEKVKIFSEKYPAKYYAIRDKSKAGGIFKLKVPYLEVLNEISGYELFSVNVSSANYINEQLLVGEIEFLSNNEVYAVLTTKLGASVRDALKEPMFNFKTNIFDNNLLNRVPYFDVIYKYAIDNKLIDVIIEFAIFKERVGINKENIIIYELRTNY